MKWLNSVTGATVPVIKFQYRKINVDLAFAAADSPWLNSSVDDAYFDNMANYTRAWALREHNISSRGGLRVCEQLRRDLADHQEEFAETLRILKTWAKVRGIYKSIFGYLNGVSLAIMLSRVIRLAYDKGELESSEKLEARVHHLFCAFFEYYSSYDWS